MMCDPAPVRPKRLYVQLFTAPVTGGASVNLGSFPINVPLTISGLGGTDSVRVVGTAVNDVIVTTSAGVVVNGAAAFTVSSVENLLFETGRGTDQIVVSSLPTGVTARTLAGGAADDLYQLDADNPLGTVSIDESVGGVDTLDFSSTALAVNVNLSRAASQPVNTNLSLILNSSVAFERAIGGSGNDTLTGNSLANVLTGNAGNDQLLGGVGRDILTGGGTDGFFSALDDGLPSTGRRES